MRNDTTKWVGLIGVGMEQQTAAEDEEWIELERFDYEKPVTAKIGECDECGAEAVSDLKDPNHPAHHPDHVSVVLPLLIETFRGGRVTLCPDCY